MSTYREVEFLDAMTFVTCENLRAGERLHFLVSLTRYDVA
jgi:hypothetical protein